MAHGKSIRIYLADGTASGMRHAEVVNWTGQALACARHRVPDLKEWPEASRPGVYFLFGQEDGAALQHAYIGEGEVVLSRLSSHVREKEFWNEVVLFTSKDEHLTKSHVKYLESRLISLAEAAGRYKLENTKASEVARLPRGDIDAMEDFIEHLGVLLGALGHRILDPVTAPMAKASSAIALPTSVFRFSLREAKATLQLVEDGYVVMKGSTAIKNNADGLAASYVQLRAKLLQEGVIIERETALEFARDYLFTSPTAAVSVVAGSVRNGREVWKDDAGRTLNSIEEASWGSLPTK